MDREIANLYDAGKVQDAIHQLIEKIDKNPQKAENYLQLSTYLMEQGSSDQAAKLLEEAKHLVKKPQELDYNLAVCYYMQGDFDKSLALLEKIPNDDMSLYQKALVYLKLGQSQKALAYAMTIKKIDNRTKELLGDIWLSLGDVKQAEKTYRQITEEERNSKVNFLIGICLLEKNRDEAEKFFTLSKKQDAKYFEQAKNQYSAIMKMINDKENRNG
ncbi:tetratricopeptide repeat protein [Lactobacillus sp. PSON]|uniref:tetratricopeptide repeat protein n=1 Tax=Lactobacillus sp. PSON TaxID=3455454 RepID=UPI004042686B